MDDRIRASDADRDRVAARLRDHFAEGRLTRDELDERISSALGAKTFGDLRRVLADLPEPGQVPAWAGRPIPMGAPPGRIYWQGRRAPRVLPLLVFGLLLSVLISGGGAAVVAAKVVTVTFAIMFAVFVGSAFAAARLIRRARQHWYASHMQVRNWPDGFSHHTGYYRW